MRYEDQWAMFAKIFEVMIDSEDDYEQVGRSIINRGVTYCRLSVDDGCIELEFLRDNFTPFMERRLTNHVIRRVKVQLSDSEHFHIRAARQIMNAFDLCDANFATFVALKEKMSPMLAAERILARNPPIFLMDAANHASITFEGVAGWATVTCDLFIIFAKGKIRYNVYGPDADYGENDVSTVDECAAGALALIVRAFTDLLAAQ